MSSENGDCAAISFRMIGRSDSVSDSVVPTPMAKNARCFSRGLIEADISRAMQASVADFGFVMLSVCGIYFGTESDPEMPKSCSLLRVINRMCSLPVRAT